MLGWTATHLRTTLCLLGKTSAAITGVSVIGEALEVGVTASLTLVAEPKAIDCFVSRWRSESGVGITAKT